MGKKVNTSEAENKNNTNSKLVKKKSGGKKTIPRTVQQTLPYIEAYDNGVMQVEPGCFTRMYEFEDTSFKSRSEEDQETIYEHYMKFLNSINPEEDIFFSFVNSIEDSKEKLERIAPLLRGDRFDEYRKEVSEVLRMKMQTTRNNVSTKKYLISRVKADSVDKAMSRLLSLGGELDASFRHVTQNPLKGINLATRLEILNGILNSNEKNYWFQHDAQGNTSVDWVKMGKNGLTTKDIIAPESLKFLGSNFQIGERYGQVLYLDNVANWMNTNFLADLVNTSFESVITLHIQAIPQEEAIKKIHNQSVNITAEVMQKQKKALEGGYSPEFIPADLKYAKEAIDRLQEDMMNRDQKMFFMTLTLVHFAPSLDILKEQTNIIKSVASKYMSSIKPLVMQQERGLATALPMGINKIFSKRLLTTESLGVFIPFNEISQFDDHGFYYGVNSVNKSIIVYNRKKGVNYNGLIFGASGCGKSFSTKLEIANALLNTDDHVIVVDPDGEYTPLANAFGGSIVKIAPGNNVYINPLDLDVDISADTEYNPITMKVDFICGMLETMLGGNTQLTPVQKTIVDRVVRQVYRPYLEHLQNMPVDSKGRKPTIDRNTCPTLQQLFDAFLSQPQPEAQNLALVMETYTTGSFDTFAHRTNVDLDNRFIIYDIKNIGSNLKELALKVCMNDSWNKMMENSRNKNWTRFYIDEFHLLLSNYSTAEFLKSVWKRARKFMGMPTGITQNVEELLNSPAARAIINNTSFVYMLNQSAIDRNMLAELLQLSESDTEFITNAAPGHGLIYTGKQAIPFENDFPTDTKLYKIISTKAGE